MLRPFSFSPARSHSSFCFLVSSFPHLRRPATQTTFSLMPWRTDRRTCATVSSAPFGSLTKREQYQEFFQGRLLLQISEERSIKMRFGRHGRLLFFLREQALKARDFSKVWVTEQ
jgi:uncharacterized protein YwqG